MERHRRAAAFALLVAVALGGCGGGSDGPDGSVAPTGSASSELPASPDPDEPGGRPDSAPEGTTPPGDDGDGDDSGDVPGGDGTGDSRPYAVRVVLVRSGGFAGISDQVTVEPDGRWTFTTLDGGRQAGRLTDDQLAELRELASSPRLREEAAEGETSRPCADAYAYRLTVHETTLESQGCGGIPSRPTFGAIVTLLTDATPL